MKIAVIANTSWNLYNFRRNLIQRIQQEGHEVHLIAPFDSYSEKLRSLGTAYHPLYMIPQSKNPFHEVRTLIHLYLILRRLHSDVALTFTPKANLYTGLCRYAITFFYLPNISGMGQSFRDKGILRRIVTACYALTFRRADVIFFQNYEDKIALSGPETEGSKRVRILPGSGVDTVAFCPPPTPTFHRPRRFLMYGRLIPEKGYDMFLDVAEKIYNPDDRVAEFRVMAIPENTSESKRLHDKIQRFHRAGIIQNVPRSDRVTDVLHQTDVVVLPSVYHEGVPRTLLEAMACGKPIITTDWKGCRQTIPNGNNGILIQAHRERLEEAVRYLANASDAELGEMGKNGRQLAQTVFSENLVIDAYCREIKDLSCAADRSSES